MKIIDTSIWVSFFNPADSNNSIAHNIFLTSETGDIVVFDYIYTESMNVFRAKFSDNYCTNFSRFLTDLEIPVRLVEPGTVKLANIYFFQFKKLSFTDCLMLASAKINNYELSTFDDALQKAATIALVK